MVAQFIQGTQYIDELVMMRVAGKGELFVHQDANYNVIALTDLAGRVVERYEYTPYGQVTVHAETYYGDFNGDGVVNGTDQTDALLASTSPLTGACRLMDLDFDGDLDKADDTAHSALPQGQARHPGLKNSLAQNLFLHQGLLFDPELASFQNRARQYMPVLKRFAQRDPAGYGPGMNVYAYVGGSPTRFLDPSGRWGLFSLLASGFRVIILLPGGIIDAVAGVIQEGDLEGVVHVGDYGKYCGAQHGGGYDQSCYRSDPPGSDCLVVGAGDCPRHVDRVDLCCVGHDQCRLDSDDDGCVDGLFPQRVQECDYAMCGCLSHINPWALHGRAWTAWQRMWLFFGCDFAF